MVLMSVASAISDVREIRDSSTPERATSLHGEMPMRLNKVIEMQGATRFETKDLR